MATYSGKASAKVGEALHEEKRGKLKSGRSGDTVTSRKQAIAIGLSEARKAGAKLPDKPGAAKKTAAKKTTAKTTARKTASPAKTASKQATAKKKAS